MDRLRLALIAAVAALALAACSPRQETLSGTPRPHTALDEHGTALREAFNADWGHVRVLLLVAPT
jgi:hypothetical protein